MIRLCGKNSLTQCGIAPLLERVEAAQMTPIRQHQRQRQHHQQPQVVLVARGSNARRVTQQPSGSAKIQNAAVAAVSSALPVAMVPLHLAALTLMRPRTSAPMVVAVIPRAIPQAIPRAIEEPQSKFKIELEMLPHITFDYSE